jgi:hypothetical protein
MALGINAGCPHTGKGRCCSQFIYFVHIYSMVTQQLSESDRKETKFTVKCTFYEVDFMKEYDVRSASWSECRVDPR